MKKEDTKRFCTGFRNLNNISKKYSWPLPAIGDILAALGKAKYFITLDLYSGYWQIPLNEEDKEKNTFACARDLFEYNVLLLSFANAPKIFQELMSIVLHGLGDFAMPYLDDIIVLRASDDKQKQHIPKIFLLPKVT